VNAATLRAALVAGTPIRADASPVLTETCVVDSVQDFAELRTAGNRRTRIVWRGPNGDPVLVFRNCRDLSAAHLDIVIESPTEAAVVCERTKTGPGVIPSTLHQFRDVRVFGNTLAEHGFWYRATVDENNEHGRFDCVSVYGCAMAAWTFNGQQSKEHLLTHCRSESVAVGVASDSGFQWIGGTCAVCEVGVHLTRAGEPVTLQGVGFEACGRMLVTDGPTTAAQPVTLINVRYEADQLHGDGRAIVLRHAGPLVMIGGRYGGGKQPCPRVALLGTGQQTLEMRGVTFGSFGAHRVAPVVAQNPPEAVVSQSGVVCQSDEGDPQNTQPMIVGVERAT
jgi:hypothetical protein